MKPSQQSRVTAFAAAFKGLSASIKSEVHMRIHLAAAILCLCTTWYLNISGWQFLMLLLCIVLVMVAELFNTAIEKLCDVVQPEFDARIGFIKDISSAAVLLCAIFAVVCAVVILFPPLLEKLV